MSEIKKIVAASFAASLVLATVLIIKTGYASVAGENTGIKTVLPSVIRDNFENVPESDKDADIEISYGYGNSARTGRYLPVHINYRVKSDHLRVEYQLRQKLLMEMYMNIIIRLNLKMSMKKPIMSQ